MFVPLQSNCDIDGSPWGDFHEWSDMNWAGAEWSEKSIWGDDPHWLVPHIDGDTFHRVRLIEMERS